MSRPVPSQALPRLSRLSRLLRMTRKAVVAAMGLTAWLSLDVRLDAQLAPAPVPGSSSTAAGQGLLAPAPAAVRGRYLDATPTVSRDPRTGQLTLAVDITPKPGMRVYAPGNKDYKPVDLVVEPATGFTTTSTKYPVAEDFVFAPTHERVKVYTSTFRLTRDLVGVPKKGPLGGADAATNLTVTGRVEYQACDDTVCYLPQTVPMTWSLPR